MVGLCNNVRDGCLSPLILLHKPTIEHQVSGIRYKQHFSCMAVLKGVRCTVCATCVFLGAGRGPFSPLSNTPKYAQPIDSVYPTHIVSLFYLDLHALSSPTHSRYRENREASPDQLQVHMETRFEQLKVQGV